MILRTLSLVLLTCVFALPVMAAQPTREVTFASDEAGIILKGYWTPPDGATKAPAVVALHGCGGLPQDRGTLNYAQNRYIRIFHDVGVGTLYLDSFGPRGQTSICEQKLSQRSVTEANRRLDVSAALQWLARQPEVSASQLAVVGWSHGGQTVLASADRSADAVAKEPVKPAALVAFYPGCNAFERQWGYHVVAPLLVMSGELDNWTPAAPCKLLTDRLIAAQESVRYVQYPGSYHAFDAATPVVERDNVGGTASGKAMAGGNPEARAGSAREMLQFLSHHWAFPIDLAVLDETMHAKPVPPASGFAALDNADAVPRVSEKGKALYREWLDKPFPRAVAVSFKGAIARGYGRSAMETAIKNCEKFDTPCRLYAVDDAVVWTAP